MPTLVVSVLAMSPGAETHYWETPLQQPGSHHSFTCFISIISIGTPTLDKQCSYKSSESRVRHKAVHSDMVCRDREWA